MPWTFFSRTFGNNTGGGGGADPPSAPTLAIADNGDGTGGVATITASDGSPTNTLYYQSVTTELGTDSWHLLDSTSGDDVLPFTLTPGLYWFKVISSNADGTSTSNLVYAAITDDDDSVFKQCLDAVAAKIVLLSLAGIGTNVLVRKLPYKHQSETLPLPCVLVTPLTESMNPAAGTNIRDDVGYGVQVTLAQASNRELVTNLDRLLLWRQQVARAFRNQRLPGVSEVIMCAIEPGPVVHPLSFENQHDVASLVVRCLSREVRGI